MRTTSTQGVFHLASGDKLIVIASTSGNTATTNTHTKVELQTKVAEVSLGPSPD